MATLHIDILNPNIDLITNKESTSNSCKTIYTFEVQTTVGAEVKFNITNLNELPTDYDKFEVSNLPPKGGNLYGRVWKEHNLNDSIIMTGESAFVRLTIGNVDPNYVVKPTDSINDKTGTICNGVIVGVTDLTNIEEESSIFQRCNVEVRCDVPSEPTPSPTNPNPEPEAPTIDVNTNIRIYFDASGSMNSTLAPLKTMRDTLLRDALLPYYNNSISTYNSKVTIREVTLNNAHKAVYEDPFGMLNYENQNVSGKVISLVFMDEADIFAWSPFNKNATRSPNHDISLSRFRNRLNNFPTNYYKGVLFQVATPDDGSGDMTAFKPYMEAVKFGQGSYAGVNGLSDRSEVNIKLNTTPAETPTYYKNLIIEALNELGFNL